MELIKIIEARRVLDSFANKQDIGAHLAYWMTKFVVVTRGEYEFYTRSIRKIVDKYNTGEVQNSINVREEDIPMFENEIHEIESTLVEDPGIRFSLSELSKELKLSMQQMLPLLDFIDENK